MTTRRDMTFNEFNLALANQGFLRVVRLGSVYYLSHRPDTDTTMRYFPTTHTTLPRRMTIKDLIARRRSHERHHAQSTNPKGPAQ